LKKLTVTLLLALFVPTLVFAADFVPVNKLDIDVPDFVQYNFDGKPVDIPVGVDGTPARAYLVIETTGLAGTKFRVRNGRIGWHTVCGIDTTVYNSTGEDLAKGSKYITWPGVDNDGNAVPEGEYTYHVWAFDYMNLLQGVHPMANYDRCAAEGRMLLQTTAQDGTLLPKPWLSTVSHGRRAASKPYADWTDDEKANESQHMWMRWSIGNDTQNMELIETCDIIEPEGWTPAGRGAGRCPYDPEDFNYIFRFTDKIEEATAKIRKFKLVSNDYAEEITDWGQDLVYGYALNYQECGCDLINNFYITASTWQYSKSECNSYLLIATVEGDKVEDIYLEEMDKAAYVAEHGEVLQAGAPMSGIAYMNDTRLAHGSIWCFQSATDPVRYLESGNYEDLFLAINEEGDGFIDKGYSANNPFPDYCYAEDPPWNYLTWGSESGFVISAAHDGGPISWCLLAPDFTACNYCTRAGEDDAGCTSIIPVESGGPYDGLYIRPRGWATISDVGYEGVAMGYIGSDSDKGTISKKGGVGVAAAAPAEFSVAQNVPNPCNPTTTINYTIPESGNVTVDVFNVTGQKVDTLVNNYLDAGSHSVVWDGSSKSSGVYFYTVTSGEFSKTMKMTLLK